MRGPIDDAVACGDVCLTTPVPDQVWIKDPAQPLGGLRTTDMPLSSRATSIRTTSIRRAQAASLASVDVHSSQASFPIRPAPSCASQSSQQLESQTSFPLRPSAPAPAASSCSSMEQAPLELQHIRGETPRDQLGPLRPSTASTASRASRDPTDGSDTSDLASRSNSIRLGGNLHQTM